ncbi:GDP-Man:Man(3)GlcNAc(2)-PP-Dol alpha-1,2-mannosyltransferase-like isoform X2 [Patiria miniata]|uniref:GDP-Man:Man(3)GlcNAc(2)-PP-Dol alpha-1,2-mannosyltransferase n=1 Tax=Patiria miniata TaxID=46514 RepID=A0A914AI76_PATMI|nr:GDP-Man:Man(3)GlcNAc(2)-PP-Dol alpha-1,2-mannosyltransferase-like isoform X2 [Patiria miniata]
MTVKTFVRCLYSLLKPMLFLLLISLPLGVLLFYALRRRVQQVGRRQYAHLRERGQDGRKPVVVGFFHPYCNAGGGGERVLWCAIAALQERYSYVRCVVYTGDSDVRGEEIVRKAKQRFNITLTKPVEFVFLKKRHLVEAETYPFFTLLGQSLGSVILGWEALTNCVPDVYIDSMGYAFTLPLFKFLGLCKVGCYVHYPTISTDMLSRVAQRTATYNNPGFVARSRVLSSLKLVYYRLFARLYGVMGARSDAVMVNSSWTNGHIQDIWRVPERTSVVYPPCDTDAFLQQPLAPEEGRKKHVIVSIAQFRPEKDHPLQVKAFNELLRRYPIKERESLKLELIGSCRNQGDADRIDMLREMCEEFNIRPNVDFLLNISFDDLKAHLSAATIGLHTMWNEHFGIGVVECMAAGTVIVAHNSGGPKMDIVVDVDGKITGFLADDVKSYADAMETILKMTPEERLEIRQSARESVGRFSEQEFKNGFLAATEVLIN